MRVINVSLNELETKVLMIGFQGENEITQVRIDAAEILTDYPTATPTLIVKPLFGFAYPVIVTMDDTDVVWNIDNSVLSSHGDGEIQLTFTAGTVIAKSYVGRIRIKRSLAVNGEAPDPIETWEQAATAKLAEVDAQIGELEDMVEAAEAAKDQAQDIVDDAAADIQAAGAAQVQVVQAAGEEVLESIPSDYTELSDDVSGLKSALNDIEDELDFGSVSTETDVTGDLVSGKKFDISANVGGTVSPTMNNNQNYRCASWQVTAGDQFVITGRLGYAFTDKSYVIVSKVGDTAIFSQDTITATVDGYLFLNSNANIARTIIWKTSTPITLQDKLDEKLDVDQGVANAGKLLGIGPDGAIEPVDSIETDPTLSEQGEAADAAAVGTALNGLKVEENQKRDQIESNIIKVANMFSDPTFEDLTNGNNFEFTSQASKAVSNGVLTCVSEKSSSGIKLYVADSQDTDIIYFNYKVSASGLNGYSLSCSCFGKSAIINTETVQQISGYAFGGASKYLGFSISGNAVRTISIYCPIAINITKMFGAGHELSIQEFEGMFANWDRDKIGEWISFQKYDFLQKWSSVPAQNLAAKTPLDAYRNLVTKFTETATDVTGTGDKTRIGSSNISFQGLYSPGDVLYTSITAKVGDSECQRLALYQDSTGSEEKYKMDEIVSPAQDTWYRLSGIAVPASTGGTERFSACFAFYADEATQSGKTLSYKLGMALNLTTIFGKGHEPMDASIVDAMLEKFPNQWFMGIRDIWHPAYSIGMNARLRQFANGAYYGEDGEGRFIASSVIDTTNEDWTHAQYTYGLDKRLVKVPHQFDGGIETNGMYTVMLPKYARWERGAAGENSGSLFGGHVFEAWNNIGTYRLTMMMAHGGDRLSYTDEDDVTTETAREDEACIIVYSPGGSYNNPLKTPTELQSHLRIRKSRDDYYFGTNPQNLLGRVRIGSDTANEGVVFTRTKMISYNQMILADKTQENKGKLLKFNNDGTVTWEEVDLYGNWAPEE